MSPFSKSQKIVLILLVGITVLIWYVLFSEELGVLTVAILDVGQGDAIFIETAEGRQMLIDGGPGRAVLAELGEIMEPYDKSIDYILATHTDFDHLAGLLEVLKNYQVGGIIESGFIAESALYAEWEKVLEEKGIPRVTVRGGDRLILDSSAYLNILGPLEEDFDPMPTIANEVMIVGQLVHGNTEFLFTGDLERGDEVRLAQMRFDLTSDVLKIPHHGSKYSSTDFFLQKVKPTYSVISVGRENRYGHPHPEAVQRISALENSLLLRTDEHGRIVFRSDGVTLTSETEKGLK